MTSFVKPPSLLSPSLSNEFLFDRLMEHHQALLDLQRVGIVQTNFMKCDETTIYVFSSLLDCIPSALKTERFEIFRRYRNVSFVELCAFHLRNGGDVSAADFVETMKTDADLSLMSSEDALVEHKKAYLWRLLEMCHGLLTELVDRKLVSFGDGPGFKLRAEINGGYETAKVIVRVKSSHITPKVLFERISSQLQTIGFNTAASRVSSMYNNIHYL